MTAPQGTRRELCHATGDRSQVVPALEHRTSGGLAGSAEAPNLAWLVTMLGQLSICTGGFFGAASWSPFADALWDVLHATVAGLAARVRDVAQEFGRLFDVRPIFVNKEAPTALLNNSGHAYELFGRPETPVKQVIKWIAGWLVEGKDILGKPTHFEVRDGKY